MPHISREPNASPRTPSRRSTPALASAKTGTTTWLVGVCSASCRRSLTEMARVSDRRAARCTPGIGDCRKARKLRAASSTSDRRGSRAGTSRPLSMPAIEACTPDSRVANHSTSTTST